MTNRKMSIHVTICIGLCILTTLKYLFQATVLLVPFLKKISGFGQEATSIGIIGGADGPTAIFISVSNACVLLLPTLELAGALYVTVVLILCFRWLLHQGESFPD